MNHYIVTAAIIINNNQILCMQRGPSKYDYISCKYEFPGGKVEQGESLEACLSRELNEELAVDIEVNSSNLFKTVEHKYADFSITLHSFICPVNNRAFIMKAHIGFCWLLVKDMMTLDWAAADIPILEELLEVYSHVDER